MFKSFLKKGWPIIMLIILNGIFFAPLFFPNLKLIVTPEYGGGDETIFHYPVKFFLKESYRKGIVVPFWSKDIGAGYPLYAQQESGFLNPINYLTIRFLPFVTSINFQIYLYFLILLTSSYYLARTLGLQKMTSMFFSTVYAYSFFIITNIIHFSHMASFVFFPILFALVLRYLQESESRNNYLVFFIFVSFLQLTAGHIQYSCYTHLFIVSYVVLFWRFERDPAKRKRIFSKGIYLVASYGVIFLLSAVQLFPTYEFYAASNREAIPLTSRSVSSNLSLSSLLTFFYPFLFYSPSLVRNSLFDYTPPWDGNYYYGIPPFLFLFLLAIPTLRSRIFKRARYRYIFLLLLFFFILLSFGANSPLYLLFYMPPLSFFRVSGRFVLFVVFLCVLFSSFVFEELYKKKNQVLRFGLILVTLINFVLNMLLMYTFHTFQDEKGFFSQGKTIRYLKESESKRILNPFYFSEVLPNILYVKGILRNIPVYSEIIKNGLPLDYNLFYGISHVNESTSAFNLFRHKLYLFLVESNVNYPERLETYETPLSESAKNLLYYAAVDTILSPYALKDTDTYLRLKEKIPSFLPKLNYFIYEVKGKKNRVQFYTKYMRISTFKDFQETTSEDQDVKDTVFIEEDSKGAIKTIGTTGQLDASYFTEVDENEYLRIKTKTSDESILVLADTFYPGWELYIDGKKTSIFHANILFRGTFLPRGTHRVEYVYKPVSFYYGLVVSLVTIVGFIAFLFRKRN
ncbi:hypothetical protein COT62_02685 [Candidatus Roizmanbacteria bacterium CG09_land_8_20_14_0_10_41_9]|uniref:Membrane protein 6-pyruvoyl-tetrahydropterin synthase-related domain-containing protein n=1 Tax=Candidatus Roizmanbacteria bacterium CG09_land_8_20_14_0_10_41_9 TaxID=1974850 RepID=A0A2H0WUP1_9BACT|nr:MAG: hypothetical protein COT62_02685 [Candidatus Roizmanbacteria bacterium CG09_land_8_20_14_0_10_41_9]